MLEKIKMYLMLRKSCDEFDKEALEKLLYDFECNLDNLNDNLDLHSDKLSDLKKEKKKNADFFWAADVDSAFFVYNKAVNEIGITKRLIQAEKTAIKNNEIAVKVIQRKLKKKGK